MTDFKWNEYFTTYLKLTSMKMNVVIVCKMMFEKKTLFTSTIFNKNETIFL